MKHSIFISIIAVLLSACTTGNVPAIQVSDGSSSSLVSSSSSFALMQKDDLWRRYENKELGVSFFYPAAYSQMQTETGGKLQYRDSQIIYDEVVVMVPGGGESPQIRMMKSHDPRIVQSVSEQPLGTVMITGKTVQKFTSEGMGTPAGFIQKIGEDYFVLTFVFPPSGDVMDRVLGTLMPI